MRRTALHRFDAVAQTKRIPANARLSAPPPSAEDALATNAAVATEDAWLQVLHLNPSTHFNRVLEEAHSIVLAGGVTESKSVTSVGALYARRTLSR